MTFFRWWPEDIWVVCDVDVSAQTCSIFASESSEGFVDTPCNYIRKDVYDAEIKKSYNSGVLAAAEQSRKYGGGKATEKIIELLKD